MSNHVVWKYKLKPWMSQGVAMPRGAQILSAREQAGDLCVWALVDPIEPEEMRQLIVLGTGWTTDAPLGRYIGACHLLYGELIYHVFEGTS